MAARRIGGRHIRCVEGLDPAGEHLAAEETEDRRQQRERDEDGYQHRAGRGQAHRREERDVDDEKGCERDEHGRTGEDNGRTCCADGFSGCFGTRLGGVHLMPVAGEDEQRVVDADRQTDHRREDRGLRAEIEEERGCRDSHHADHNTDDCGDERHAPGDQRREGEDHDDRTDAHTDELRGETDCGLRQGRTRHLDREASLARLIGNVFHLLVSLCAHIRAGLDVEGRTELGHGLVFVDR